MDIWGIKYDPNVLKGKNKAIKQIAKLKQIWRKKQLGNNIMEGITLAC